MAKPVLLTVDDDPVVSRAVARDLRRRYGKDYRVMQADSGAAGLAALRELKLRGEPVAAMLADYRMPQMNGIEFLEQAMDLFPLARRALLTAYADTDAAIQAINLVDVDHYLIKPWNPAEEKLYPVVDALVEIWQSTGDHAVTETKLIGHRWSIGSHQARDFLARNLVPYRWYGAEEPEGLRLLEAAGATDADVPVLITPDGTVLRAPAAEGIAAAVGFATRPAADFYDLIVIGAGPAGLGAAVYGASEGFRTVLVERRATGGQAGQSSRIENYLGFPDGVSGAQLTDRARRQALRFGVEMLMTRDVVGLAARGSARVVRFGDRSEIAAHAVILATGVDYRSLGAPGIDELTGRGVYYGSTLIEASDCAGQDVYIVGGANAAGQAALHFSRFAKRVVLLVRGSSLWPAMSHYLLSQIEATDNIDVRTGTVVERAHGHDRLECLTLSGPALAEPETVPAGHLFVFIGAVPCTDWLSGVLQRDQYGFVYTGSELGRRPSGWTLDRDPYYLESSLPGVFAAGDVRAESVKRVASAVGEGAMAVTQVRRYLADR